MELKVSMLTWFLFAIIISLSTAHYPRPPRYCCDDPNEEYSDCGPSCGGDGCRPIEYVLPCNQTCQPGCFCKCGYFRNFEGVCVLPQDCPDGLVGNVGYPKVCPGHQCCGQFEYFTESNGCIEECLPANVPSTITIPPCRPEVEPGCYCLPGYRRNQETGVCGTDDQCPRKCL